MDFDIATAILGTYKNSWLIEWLKDEVIQHLIWVLQSYRINHETEITEDSLTLM